MITVNEATDVYAKSGRLSGTVNYTGGEAPSIIIVWGEADEGTDDHEDWDDFATLGNKEVGLFLKTVTGLSRSTQYFFRAKATNEGGSTWSASKTFTTLANSVKPVLGNINMVTNVNRNFSICILKLGCWNIRF